MNALCRLGPPPGAMAVVCGAGRAGRAFGADDGRARRVLTVDRAHRDYRERSCQNKRKSEYLCYVLGFFIFAITGT